MDHYTKAHAWQWNDKQFLKDSYGNFDVIQFYNNYYIGGLNKNAVTRNADVHHVDTQRVKKQPANNMTTDNG